MRISRSFAVILADDAPDFVQQLHRQGADRFAQVVQNERRGEIRDSRKIVVVHIFVRLITAALQQSVLDARRQDAPEAHFKVEIVQFLQKAAARIVAKVIQVVTVDLPNGLFRQFHQAGRRICGHGFPVARFQGVNDRFVILLAQFP